MQFLDLQLLLLSFRPDARKSYIMIYYIKDRIFNVSRFISKNNGAPKIEGAEGQEHYFPPRPENPYGVQERIRNVYKVQKNSPFLPLSLHKLLLCHDFISNNKSQFATHGITPNALRPCATPPVAPDGLHD